MFKKVKIKNFRGISNLEIDNLEQINVFVGENNSGKSTALESLFLLTGISNMQLVFSVNKFRNMVISASKSDRETILRTLFKNLNFNEEIVLEGFTDNTNHRKLKIKANRVSELSQKRLDTMMSENDMSMSSSTNLSGIDGLSYEFSVTSDHKTKNYNAKLINHDAGVDISHVETYKETLHGIYVSPNPFEIAQRFGKMVTEKKKNSLIEILNKIEPKIIDLELGENGIIYCDVGLDRLIPLNAMGDGIVKIVSIITSMFYCENGVVFIDEIENGFHYKSLKILWKGVLEAAKELNIQVFASTHSIECIIALNEVSNEIEDKLKVYRFEKNDGNYSVAEYSKKILATTLERKWELR